MTLSANIIDSLIFDVWWYSATKDIPVASSQVDSMIPVFRLFFGAVTSSSSRDPIRVEVDKSVGGPGMGDVGEETVDVDLVKLLITSLSPALAPVYFLVTAFFAVLPCACVAEPKCSCSRDSIPFRACASSASRRSLTKRGPRQKITHLDTVALLDTFDPTLHDFTDLCIHDSLTPIIHLN